MEQARALRIIDNGAGYNGNTKAQERRLCRFRRSNPFIPPQTAPRYRTMRRSLVFSLFSALSLGVLALGPEAGFAQNPSKSQIQPFVPPRRALTATEQADLKRASDYLNT